MIDDMTDEQFNENFRMAKGIFEKLIFAIQNESSSLVFREDIYIFVFFLSYISTYRKMRENFGIPTTTIFKRIEKISYLIHKIAKKFIKFSTSDEYQDLKNDFIGDR